MNFLAHAYLSFNHPELLVGNMISDFVKGKKKFDYSAGIQQGIHLHRQIDAFTDDHEATRKASVILKPAAGAYSGAFVDVAYDHFLAHDINEFSDETLQNFTRDTYHILEEYKIVLPDKFRAMLPHMQSQNWLYNYKNMRGAENSFRGVAARAIYLQNSDPIFQLFRQEYSSLQDCYKTFFPFVKAFAVDQISKLADK